MADVNISKYRASVVRDGSKPASPGFVVSEGQDPVNPPGTNNFVPYTGATANVELGEFGLETGFVTLDTTPTNIPTEQGAIYWDDAKSTAALIMNGTTQHIGQDTFFYVKNSSGSSIPKGTAVRFDGTNGASGHILIAPFLADGTYPSSYFMGVTAETIANGSFGQVMHFGELNGIDTSGYTAGDLLYASSTVAGAFQTTAPVAPNNIVLIAASVNSTNNGAIIVRPQIGSNINNDEGVKITSGATGDLLQLQAGGLWENKTLAQVLGGTSSQFVKGNGSLDSTAYQPLLTNPVTGTGTTNVIPKFTGASSIGNSSITDNTTEVNISKRIFVTDSSHSISFQPNLSATTNRIESTALPFEIFTTGSALRLAAGGVTTQFTLASTGVVTLTNLAGSGSRIVVADASGNLSASSALSGYVQGSGTTNYLPKFTGSTTIGNSALQDDGTNVNVISRELRINRGTYSGFAFGIDQQSTFAFGSTNGKRVSIIYDSTAADNGLQFGYDTIDKTGIIAGAATSAGAGIDFYTFNGSSWGNRARVTASGNLLVGTTTDNGARLQVSGTSTFSAASTDYALTLQNVQDDSQGLLVRATDNDGSLYLIRAQSSNSSISQTWVDRFTITKNGAATFSSSVTATSFSSTPLSLTPFLDLTYNSTAGLKLTYNAVDAISYIDNYYHNTINTLPYGDIRFRTKKGGVNTLIEALTISGFSGYVGIGTSSPARKLDVNGVTRSTAFDVYYNSVLSGFLLSENQWTGNSSTNLSLAAETGNAITFFTNGSLTERMRITSGGNVLIGTTTEAAGVRLRVEGGVIRSLSTYDNTTATAANLVVSAGGTFERSTSSLKYKKEVRDYDKGFEVLKNLRPVYYKGKSESDGNKQFAGLIAEEVQELGLTEFVQYAQDGTPDALAYTHMIALLINSIKELKQEIDTLKN